MHSQVKLFMKFVSDVDMYVLGHKNQFLAMASGQIMKKPDLLKLIILQLKKQRPREK